MKSTCVGHYLLGLGLGGVTLAFGLIEHRLCVALGLFDDRRRLLVGAGLELLGFLPNRRRLVFDPRRVGPQLIDPRLSFGDGGARPFLGRHNLGEPVVEFGPLFLELCGVLGGKGLGGFFGSLCLGLDPGAVLLCFGNHRLCSGLRIGLDCGTLGERLRKHLLGFGFESCCVLFGSFSDLGASLVEAGQNRLHAFFRVRDQFVGRRVARRRPCGRPRDGPGPLDPSSEQQPA